MTEPYCYVGPRRIAAALLLAGFPDNDAKLAELVATHGAETSGNVWAIGGPNPNGSYDYGAFQINVPPGSQGGPYRWDNYVENAKLAVKLYNERGFKPWYGHAKIDQLAGFAAPRMAQTWRRWATLGVADMRNSLAHGRKLEVIASLYLPYDGA